MKNKKNSNNVKTDEIPDKLISSFRLFFYLFVFFCFLGILQACKSSGSTAKVALTEVAKKERIQMIATHALEYETITASLRLGIKPGEKAKNKTVNGQLSIKKDQAIQLSLRVPILGEMAKMIITPEQILLIDRYHKMYFFESMQTMKEKISLDFDYYNLQALFTNQFFIAGKSSLSYDDFDLLRLNEDEYFVYLNTQDTQGINYDFMSDYTCRILKTEIYKNKGSVNLVWEYDDFGLASNNKLFPMKMKMDLNLPNDVIQMNFNLSNVSVNAPFIPKLDVPEKYKRITYDQAVQLLKSL